MTASVRLHRGTATTSDVSEALDELGVVDGDDFLISRCVDDEREGRPGPSSNASTSRQAALANFPRKGSQRYRVLSLLVSHPLGLTREEMSRGTGLDGDSVRPRVWELIKGGWAEETTATRRTRDGNQAIVVRLTPKGREEWVRDQAR